MPQDIIRIEHARTRVQRLAASLADDDRPHPPPTAPAAEIARFVRRRVANTRLLAAADLAREYRQGHQRAA